MVTSNNINGLAGRATTHHRHAHLKNRLPSVRHHAAPVNNNVQPNPLDGGKSIIFGGGNDDPNDPNNNPPSNNSPFPPFGDPNNNDPNSQSNGSPFFEPDPGAGQPFDPFNPPSNSASLPPTPQSIPPALPTSVVAPPPVVQPTPSPVVSSTHSTTSASPIVSAANDAASKSAAAAAKTSSAVTSANTAGHSTGIAVGVTISLVALFALLVALTILRKRRIKEREQWRSSWKAGLVPALDSKRDEWNNQDNTSASTKLMSEKARYEPASPTLSNKPLPDPSARRSMFIPPAPKDIVITPPPNTMNNPHNNTIYQTSRVGTVMSPQGEIARVRRGFLPSLPDELPITIGESVQVVTAYDDGWSLCKNAQGERGMVPLECLHRTEMGMGMGEMGDQAQDMRGGDQWRMSKRASSLYAGVAPQDGY